MKCCCCRETLLTHLDEDKGCNHGCEEVKMILPWSTIMDIQQLSPLLIMGFVRHARKQIFFSMLEGKWVILHSDLFTLKSLRTWQIFLKFMGLQRILSASMKWWNFRLIFPRNKSTTDQTKLFLSLLINGKSVQTTFQFQISLQKHSLTIQIERETRYNVHFIIGERSNRWVQRTEVRGLYRYLNHKIRAALQLGMSSVQLKTNQW